MEDLILQAKTRESTGGLTARRLRRQGLTPAVVYGHNELKSICVNYHEFEMLTHVMHSEHAVIKLKIDGKEFDVLTKDVQRNCVTHNISHIDFLVINLDEIVKIEVQLETQGEAEGVKNHGGVLELLRRDVTVECKAGSIPEAIKIDVTALNIHDVIHIKELPEIDGVTYIGDPETTLITVAPPTVHEEEVEATEEEAETAEPEVIGEKKEEEE
ncbi:MAG: 50S ribosomal protein L25 [Chlamydiae bacterium]|nr:MAG: 50S ribosomal protein L25 [Chlamydiota bacterium]